MKKTFIFVLFVVLSCSMSYGQSEHVKRVAILNVIDKSNSVTDGVKAIIVNKLSFAIANIPGYEAYDRVDIASIMDEQKFQRTGLVDDSQIKRLGEMTGANYILVTEVAPLDEQQIIITAKILDVESAQVDNETYTRTKIDASELEKKCSELAKTLLRWTSPIDDLTSEVPFFIVEQMPIFQGGGVELFRAWMMQNLEYPMIALENGVQGRVVVTFVVEKDGSVTPGEILQSPDKLLSDEVIRLLKSAPKWTPGMQRNFYVRVKYTLPIEFRIPDTSSVLEINTNSDTEVPKDAKGTRLGGKIKNWFHKVLPWKN